MCRGYFCRTALCKVSDFRWRRQSSEDCNNEVVGDTENDNGNCSQNNNYEEHNSNNNNYTYNDQTTAQQQYQQHRTRYRRHYTFTLSKKLRTCRARPYPSSPPALRRRILPTSHRGHMRPLLSRCCRIRP